VRTITEYLSGNFDEELRVLVAPFVGWKEIERCGRSSMRPNCNGAEWRGTKDARYGEQTFYLIPRYTTSLDACRELLADLTEGEQYSFLRALRIVTGVNSSSVLECDLFLMVTATARQICVAYLIVKGVLK